MRRHILIAAVIGFACAAACAPQTNGPAADGVAIERPNAAARVIAWPECQSLDLPTDGRAPVRCQAQTSAGLLRVSIDPPKADGEDFTLSADLIGPTDASTQAIAPLAVSRMFAPAVGDINGDAATDVLVTTDVGNVNATQTVFLLDPAAGRFVAAGEISGIGVERLPDGLIGVPARSSAASYVMTVYAVEAYKLVELAAAEVTLTAAGAAPTCQARLAERGAAGGATSALTPAQAQAKFCPIATAFFAQ